MTASRPNPHPPAAEAVLTPLQARVARDIVSLVRRENRKAGDHLVESTLARDIGTSRLTVIGGDAHSLPSAPTARTVSVCRPVANGR